MSIGFREQKWMIITSLNLYNFVWTKIRIVRSNEMDTSNSFRGASHEYVLRTQDVFHVERVVKHTNSCKRIRRSSLFILIRLSGSHVENSHPLHWKGVSSAPSPVLLVYLAASVSLKLAQINWFRWEHLVGRSLRHFTSCFMWASYSMLYLAVRYNSIYETLSVHSVLCLVFTILYSPIELLIFSSNQAKKHCFLLVYIININRLAKWSTS